MSHVLPGKVEEAEVHVSEAPRSLVAAKGIGLFSIQLDPHVLEDERGFGAVQNAGIL